MKQGTITTRPIKTIIPDDTVVINNPINGRLILATVTDIDAKGQTIVATWSKGMEGTCCSFEKVQEIVVSEGDNDGLDTGIVYPLLRSQWEKAAKFVGSTVVFLAADIGGATAVADI